MDQQHGSAVVVGDPDDGPIRSPAWYKPAGFDPARTTEGNDWFGGRSIALAYCGLPIPTPDAPGPILPGRWQHGWQFGTGVDGETSATVGVYLQYRWPIWVWNNRARTKARHQGMRATAIGAPILYLSDAPDEGPIPGSLLAIPFHSSPPYIIRVWQPYVEALADLARGFTTTTVLLGHRDYAGAGPLFAARGLRPVTLGRPHGPRFLERMRHVVRRHSMTTGEHVHSASFYAQFWKRPYLVHGPALRALHDGDGSTDPFEGPGGDPAFVARQFSAMLRGKIDMDSANYELGAGEKRTPSELRDLFGW